MPVPSASASSASDHSLSPATSGSVPPAIGASIHGNLNVEEEAEKSHQRRMRVPLDVDDALISRLLITLDSLLMIHFTFLFAANYLSASSSVSSMLDACATLADRAKHKTAAIVFQNI